MGTLSKHCQICVAAYAWVMDRLSQYKHADRSTFKRKFGLTDKHFDILIKAAEETLNTKRSGYESSQCKGR